VSGEGRPSRRLFVRPRSHIAASATRASRVTWAVTYLRGRDEGAAAGGRVTEPPVRAPFCAELSVAEGVATGQPACMACMFPMMTSLVLRSSSAGLNCRYSLPGSVWTGM